MNAADTAIAGAAAAPLSKKQKRELCEAARRAWIAVGMPFFEPEAYAAADETALSQSQAFELWRHEQQAAACGHRHLTACTQRHYALLMSHFCLLAGRHEAAEHWAVRAAWDPARQARAKLDAEIRRAEGTGTILSAAAYCLAIARRQYGVVSLEELSARQAWYLVYTMRNRIRAKRQKLAIRGRRGGA